jgi:hypothetical protein
MTFPVPTPRTDILFEDYVTLSGTSYSSDWFETSGVTTVRIAAYFQSGGSADIWVQDAMNESNNPQVIRTQSLPTTNGYVDGDVEITARYFNFELGSGTSGDGVFITVRSV